MFEQILNSQFPRLLTQVCRDPNDYSYGCFDRNWWHYRIRDFASVMLQQGGYTLYQYGKLKTYIPYADQLGEIARASAIFWNQRALKRGAFEEYYPWERGYPPLAFSTLAMSKLVLEGVIDAAEIMGGLKKASKQLQGRFEEQAGNQQVAGLAALGVIRKISPELVTEKRYQALKRETLALQHDEGWYTEYDGPDLGYLSVTLDCLWDLYDVSEDEEYLVSAKKALEFLYGIIVRREGGPGMHNARNTDYIVPYGICRFLDQDEDGSSQFAAAILDKLFYEIDAKEHFFYAIDDRYWSHYIGHSVARAQLLLQGKKDPAVRLKTPELNIDYTGSGYLFRKLNKENRLMVAAKKGGIITVYRKNEVLLSDYGWVIKSGKKQYVNHWWSERWSLDSSNTLIEIKGEFVPHSEKVSKPVLHFGLRVISFIFGSVLTRMLRNVLIFKSGSSGISFVRKINIGHEDLTVTDRIGGIEKTALLFRAPRSSKRHVASADSWHLEDFRLNHTGTPMETIIREGNTATITTIYTP